MCHEGHKNDCSAFMPDSQTHTARCYARWDTRHRHLDHHRGIKVQVIQIFSPKTSRAAVGSVTDDTLCLCVGGHKQHSQSGAAGPGTCVRLPAAHYTLCQSHVSPAPRYQPYPLPQQLKSSRRAHMALILGSHLCHVAVPCCSCLLHLTYVPRFL